MEATNTKKTLSEQLTWPLRPVATSLNGDNSWLFSFPRPKPDEHHQGKLFYHVVFEPWLYGPTSVFHSWIVHIALSKPAAINSVEAVESLALAIEEAAQAVAKANGQGNATNGEIAPLSTEGYTGPIDVILLGFHYTDHVHEETLRHFDSRIPIVATRAAAAVIQPWHHFQTVSLIGDFEPTATTWNTPSLHPSALPPWLTVFHLSGHHELNFATVIIWTNPTDGTHEVLMQSPHGYPRSQAPLEAFLRSSPPTRKLALLHGLKETRAVGVQNTYGAAAGLQLWRKLGGAGYWLPSHSDSMSYRGLMMKLLFVKDTQRTVEWALEKEEGEAKGGERPNLVDVQNGGSVVLV